MNPEKPHGDTLVTDPEAEHSGHDFEYAAGDEEQGTESGTMNKDADRLSRIRETMEKLNMPDTEEATLPFQKEKGKIENQESIEESKEKIKARADLSDEIKRRTRDLERKLEKELQKTPKPEKSKKAGSKFNRWLKGLLAGVALGGAVEKEAARYADHSEETRIIQEAADKSEKAEEYHERMRNMFIEKTGYDLLTIAEQAEFEPRFEIDNEDGEYLVHIGQSHYIEGAEDDPELLQNIVPIQKDIEKVLLSFDSSDEGRLRVFTEAVCEDNFEQEQFDLHRDLLAKITPGKGCFLDVLDTYAEEVDYFSDDTFKVTLQYAYRQKLQELAQYYDTHPDEYEPVGLEDGESFSQYGDELSFVEQHIKSKFDALGFDEVYVSGAVEKLAAEGRVVVVGAETTEGNDASFEAEDEEDAAYKRYMEAPDDDNLPLLEKEYVDKKEIHRKKCFDERETIALQRIEEERRGLDQKIIPLVYGNAHNFVDDTISFNASNPDKKIGLIKLEPLQKLK